MHAILQEYVLDVSYFYYYHAFIAMIFIIFFFHIIESFQETSLVQIQVVSFQ